MYLNAKFYMRYSLMVNGLILLYLVLLALNIEAFNIKEILSPKHNREFGLIELLQNVTLLLLITAQFPLINHNRFFYKIAQGVLLLFFVFVFLEEVDYFLHYIEVITKRDSYAINILGHRNLHNNTNVVWIRKVAYWVIVYLTGYVLFKQLKSNLDKQKAIPVFMMFFFMTIQFVLSLVYKINYGIEDIRQLISETLELNLYATWLYLYIIWNKQKIVN